MVCLGTFGKYTVVNQVSCVKIPTTSPSTRPASSVRGHHRVGFGGLRRRRPARRQRGRHRRRRDRHHRHPGGPPGRRGADLRHRPGAVQAGAGPALRGHPRVLVGRGGLRADPAGDLGADVRQGHLRHGCRLRRADGLDHGPDRQAGRVVVTNIHPMAETEVTLSLCRPDADGEADRRHASSVRPTSATTSPSCSSSTGEASSTSTAWSPPPTSSVTSTRATRTCATEEHPGRPRLRRLGLPNDPAGPAQPVHPRRTDVRRERLGRPGAAAS